MATHQNTFSVISNGAPQGGAPSRPPMTSKQAQKLYKQANKVPRRSKAEQRKWEKERQEEIKKELERERAAVKAKQARERKKAKEEEARENRRRQGQPLIDCRPSQDTIARFVRGNGTSRKRDSSGEPIPETEKPNVATATKLADHAPTSSQSTRSSRSAASQERRISMPPPPRPSQKFKSRPSAPSSSQFKTPPVLKTNPLQAPRPPPVFKTPMITPGQARSTDPIPVENPPKPPVKSRTKRFMMPKGLLPGQQPTHLKPVKQEKQDSAKQEAVKKKTDTAQPGDHKPLEPCAPTSKFTEGKKVEGKLMKPPILAESASVETSNPWDEQIAKEQREQRGNGQKPAQHGLAEQVPVERKQAVEPSKMPPAPLPSPRRCTSQIPSPEMPPPPIPRSRMTPPKVPSPWVPSPQELSPQRPPPSTQAIIQDCFDDFFPTASQLALELEDDEPNENSQAVPQTSIKEHEFPRFDGLGNFLPERAQQHAPARPVIRGIASHQAKKPRNEGGFEPHESSRDTRKPAKPSSARSNGLRHTPQSCLPATTKNQTTDPKQRENQRYPQKLDRGLPVRAPFARPTPTKPAPFGEHGQMTTNPTRKNDHLHRTPIMPKPRSILQEISRNRTPRPKPPAAAKPVLDDLFPLICTQDLMMSSQEVLEIESPAKVDSEPSSGGSLGGPEYQPSPLIEMDLAAIDWDDDLDDF